MNKKCFFISSVVLFILELFLLEGNGTYPFPEAFLPLLFMSLEDVYLPFHAFIFGILMDLSANTMGVFTFSYTLYSLILRLLMSYTMGFDYLKLPVFLIFDILVKITNAGILYLKYGHVNLHPIIFIMSVLVDSLILVGLEKVCSKKI